MKKWSAAVILAMMASICASAQSVNDFGTWASLQVNKKWEKPYAFLRAEHRTVEKVGETEAWFISAGGGYAFCKWLKSDLSYEYWRVPSASASVHKAVLSATGSLREGNLAMMLRGKYELAVNAASGAVSNTFRWRLRGQYSAGVCTPYIMYEFFHGVGGQGWIRSLHYLGTDLSLGGGHGLDIFYMYHLYNASARPGSCHLLGLGYNFTF